MSANAKKSMLTAISWVDTPQHAVEKKVEFNIAATDPKVAANDDSLSCLKNVQAPKPKMNSAIAG